MYGIEKQVYLAGPVSAIGVERAKIWREFASGCFKYLNNMTEREVIKLSVINPIRNQTTIELCGLEEDPLNVCTPNMLFERCFYDVKQADVVLAYLPEQDAASIGSSFELAWAYQMQKPIISVIPNPEDNVHNYVFINKASSIVVPTLYQGLRATASVLYPLPDDYVGGIDDYYESFSGNCTKAGFFPFIAEAESLFNNV